MIILQEKGKKFEYYVRALREQFGNDLTKLIYESNKELFLMRKIPTDSFKPISQNNLQTGRFYLINYNFNGNKIYCPIWSIDYRVSEKNKHNLYAVNLDYLPFDYKLKYFSKVYETFEQIFQGNGDSNNVLSESSIPVNFESVYKSLEKNGGYHYAITAFDINKITECFAISTNLMYVIIHAHMRSVNIALMKEQMNFYQEDNDKRMKLESLVNELDSLSETYDNDIKGYYKHLRQIEYNYKLFENP